MTHRHARWLYYAGAVTAFHRLRGRGMEAATAQCRFGKGTGGCRGASNFIAEALRGFQAADPMIIVSR